MVLQQSSRVAIYGQAKPGALVEVAGSWGKAMQVRADGMGRWSLRYPTIRPGGPHTLSISSVGESKQFSNVMLGEVWLCSGQSNMEWPLKVWPGGTQVEGWEAAQAGANQPKIRLFQVPKRHSTTPQRDAEAEWKVCTPETVANFSAVGYFFGLELFNRLNVPVGLIQSAYGGTEVELWMQPQALFSLPGMMSLADRQAIAAKGQDARLEAMESLDPAGNSSLDPSFDDSAWESVTPGLWDGRLAQWDGMAVYRARVRVSEAQASEESVLHLGAFDDWDATYVNGQRVGVTYIWNEKRAYKIPAGTLKPGENLITIRVADTGQGGGFTSPEEIRLQVGSSGVSLTGWKRRLGPTADRLPNAGQAVNLNHSTLWNGMIAPVAPYSMRGAIWYQGESNVGRGMQYRQSFPAMIQNWRSVWDQGQFPFYFVQIAPYSGYGTSGVSAELRESQLWTMKNVPNTGMVVVSDLVPDLADIHPGKKKEVGQRLALWALSETYRRPNVIASGPVFEVARNEGNQMRLRFDYAQGGLFLAQDLPKAPQAPSGRRPVAGFTIAGVDQKFVKAQAVIEGETVLVWSESVPNPVAVRYLWADADRATMFNKAGLPATSFRTDTWPGITENVKW